MTQAVIARCTNMGYLSGRTVIDHDMGNTYNQTVEDHVRHHDMRPGTYLLYNLSGQEPPQVTGTLFHVHDDGSVTFGPQPSISNISSWPPKG